MRPMPSPSDIASAFAAFRSGAAVSALDDRALIVVRGEDRTSFLQGMLSNEIASLSSGELVPALLLTDQGRVVADLRVYVLADVVWLDAPAWARDDVRTALDRFIVADDVEMEASDLAGVALRGPNASAVLSQLEAGELSGLADRTHRSAVVGGVGVRAARLSDLGVEGFHFWLEASERERLVGAFVEAGGHEASAGAVEVQRVSAGIGKLGAEFGLETLAPEVPSLEPSISYRKGCYLGQEVVERIASRGKVNWKVALLRCDGDAAVGDAVGGANGEVGRITSVTRRPDDHTVLTLARLRATEAEVGTKLRVGDGVGAEVVPAGAD